MFFQIVVTFNHSAQNTLQCETNISYVFSLIKPHKLNASLFLKCFIRFLLRPHQTMSHLFEIMFQNGTVPTNGTGPTPSNTTEPEMDPNASNESIIDGLARHNTPINANATSSSGMLSKIS